MPHNNEREIQSLAALLQNRQGSVDPLIKTFGRLPQIRFTQSDFQIHRQNMRHLWDKIDDRCKRCGLERRISFGGSGFGISYQDWEYQSKDGNWSKVLPDCTGKRTQSYDKLFDVKTKRT